MSRQIINETEICPAVCKQEEKKQNFLQGWSNVVVEEMSYALQFKLLFPFCLSAFPFCIEHFVPLAFWTKLGVPFETLESHEIVPTL